MDIITLDAALLLACSTVQLYVWHRNSPAFPVLNHHQYAMQIIMKLHCFFASQLLPKNVTDTDPATGIYVPGGSNYLVIHDLLSKVFNQFNEYN